MTRRRPTGRSAGRSTAARRRANAGAAASNPLADSVASGAVAVTRASASSGSASHVTGGFSNIQTLVGNDGTTGTSTTLTGTNTGTTYTVNQANAGTVGAFAFSGVGNLTGGTGADTFALVNDTTTTHGALSGAIDGGATASNTLDYSGTSGAVAVTLASASSGSASHVTGGVSNIQTLVGNDGTTGTSTTLTGTNTGTTYTVNQANAGTVGAFAFSGVGNLTGGTGADTFALVNDTTTTHGELSGAIDGGATASNALAYSATGGAVAVTLASASSGSASHVTGGFSNIQTLVGNDGTTGTSTTLTGTNTGTTYTVNQANAGTVGAFAFSGVGNLTGGTGADTFALVNDTTTTHGALSGALDGGAPASKRRGCGEQPAGRQRRERRGGGDAGERELGQREPRDGRVQQHPDAGGQ